MILFDTETTNLCGPDGLPLEKQNRIIELAAVKLDPRTLKETDSLNFLVNPGIAIPPESTKSHGYVDADVAGLPPFAARWLEVAKFFLGEQIAGAHNCDFDCRVLELELARLGKVTSFPWPLYRLCTVEASCHIHNRRLKLGELYGLATGGGKIQGAHKALNDTRALAVCVRWMKDKKMIKV